MTDESACKLHIHAKAGLLHHPDFRIYTNPNESSRPELRNRQEVTGPLNRTDGQVPRVNRTCITSQSFKKQHWYLPFSA
jgi:hypothetical protein